MSCPLAHLDGAYVLGALSPAERQDFERHLTDCAECGESVRELAGLPGLLAQVTAGELEKSEIAPLLANLLPGLAHAVRTSQRRRFALVAATAAVLAAASVSGLALGGAFEAARQALQPPSSTASASPSAALSPSARPLPVPMTPVAPTPVSADLALVSVPWGTRLDVACSYEEDEEGYPSGAEPSYALVVRARDGHSEQVATWRALPGRTMRLSAATALVRGDIASIEMRTKGGAVVLRLQT